MPFITQIASGALGLYLRGPAALVAGIKMAAIRSIWHGLQADLLEGRKDSVWTTHGAGGVFNKLPVGFQRLRPPKFHMESEKWWYPKGISFSRG